MLDQHQERRTQPRQCAISGHCRVILRRHQSILSRLQPISSRDRLIQRQTRSILQDDLTIRRTGRLMSLRIRPNSTAINRFPDAIGQQGIGIERPSIDICRPSGRFAVLARLGTGLRARFPRHRASCAFSAFAPKGYCPEPEHRLPAGRFHGLCLNALPTTCAAAAAQSSCSPPAPSAPTGR
jgi:hypothetical protein